MSDVMADVFDHDVVDLKVAQQLVDEGRAKIDLATAVLKLDLDEIDKLLQADNISYSGADIRKKIVDAARWR